MAGCVHGRVVVRKLWGSVALLIMVSWQLQEGLLQPTYQPLTTLHGWAQHFLTTWDIWQVIRIIKEKIKIGIYERSNLSYQLKWFCVKKNGKSLWIIHNLQLLNVVTIKDSGNTPHLEVLCRQSGQPRIPYGCQELTFALRTVKAAWGNGLKRHFVKCQR